MVKAATTASQRKAIPGIPEARISFTQNPISSLY
jgi:hypothetical protein